MNNIPQKPYKPLTPFGLFVRHNFPFVEATYEARDNYDLLCKVMGQLKKVEYNQGIAQENIEALYEFLNTLDLQDEVNNKLDEMAESGELQEIMASYLNTKAVFGFDNVEAMKNSTNLIDGSYAKTLGYYEKNDGGKATYKIRTITNDDVIDNISIIEMENDNSLIAELIFDNNILNIKQAGAIGDGVIDNTQIFTKSIEICKNKKLSLYIPIGKYNVNGTFNIDFSLKIFGEHVANNVGTWGGQDSPSFRYASIINDVNTTQNNPEYYLFNISTYNRGCVEFKDLLIEGNDCNHSALNLLYAGWTFYIENVTIDNFKFRALNCLTLYDSNILNLTIERCGKAKFENNPQYAIYMSKNLENETNTNAIHFTMLHMEFCRYYINFNNAQDISFTNCKFEITDNNPNQEEIGHVDNDIDNPHFLINNNNDSRIIFTNTTFCFRGLYTWLLENPNVSDLSSLPYAFKTQGDGTNQMANISFVGCTIFSPFNDGGFKFIDNTGHCNININDCSILNLTPRASAFIGNKYIINNNRMTYFVHTSVNSFEGVGSSLTESIITNNNIFGYTSVMNKCSNNGVNGFIIFDVDKNSIFDNNKITNFTNMPLIYFDETIKTFETVSGTTTSQTLTAPKSGKCIIKLHLTIPSGGNSGRLYVKLATTQRTTNVNLLAFQSNIPNNSTNQDFYIIDNLRKGEELKIDILQDSGTNKTIYGTFTFNYS